MLKDTLFPTKNTLNCQGKCIDLSEPVVMGILNLTPD
jgi:dihydropteroate synthase